MSKVIPKTGSSPSDLTLHIDFASHNKHKTSDWWNALPRKHHLVTISKKIKFDCTYFFI